MSEGPLRLLLDARATRRQDAEAIAQRQRSRLADMITYARARSPYYRNLYQGIPELVTDPALLPVTGKSVLMTHFDEWVTDPDVTLSGTQEFIGDPSRVGTKFLGRYNVATTSGTTGTRGIFLLDSRSLAVTRALTWRMLSTWLSPAAALPIIARRGRIAMVIATGGHFASATAAAALRKSPAGRALVSVVPVHTPLPELVERLNSIRPAILAPYASTGRLLASEQEAGRLHINPALVILSAEGLPDEDYGRIATAFGGTVGQSYAATECPFLSYSCHHGWLHVNSDWVIVEPVDANHRPVRPGEQSHTVLLSNLANRVQPILRYDLGDSVLARPDPCPCGDPLPAIRVQGRTADMLTFTNEAGAPVTITPLTFSTLLDRIPGLAQGQIVQTGPESLDLRLRAAAGADPDTLWQSARTQITGLLTTQGLPNVSVRRDQQPPRLSPGGKLRTVIPHGSEQGT